MIRRTPGGMGAQQGQSMVVAGETWSPLHAEQPESSHGKGSSRDHMALAGDPPGQSTISQQGTGCQPLNTVGLASNLGHMLNSWAGSPTRELRSALLNLVS